MGLPLRPLVPDAEKKPYQFGVCDIEASDWIKFLVIGYYSEVLNPDGSREREILEYFEDMADFCDWIFDPHLQPHDEIYAHFGGKYDFQFIIKELFFDKSRYYIDEMIPRGSGLLCFSVSTIRQEDYLFKEDEKKFIKKVGKKILIKDRTIVFKDSSALLPFSLASITENFGVENIKLSIDYESIKEVTPELLNYLKYDLKGLYQSMRKFFDWDLIKKAGHASTMASQAIKVYRTYMTKTIPSLSNEVDEFVRGSYFGGRTEIFKPFFRQNDPYTLLKTYDVNSLYPYVMWQNEFPTKYKCETEDFIDSEMGFYDVEVEVPEMYIPPLGTVFDPNGWGRFIFPTGIFRGKWTTVELLYAMSLGVKIRKVYRGLIFQNGGPIFRHYINDLYEKRKASKKNSVDDIMCKLLMNSTYGRFGLNTEREQVEFDYGQLGVSPLMEIPLNDDGSNVIRLMKKNIHLDKTFNNVAIPSYVTAYARIHMHKQYMKDESAIYYTDTDSLFTTHEYEENEKALGEMKLEYKAKSACFLLPKTYFVDTLVPFWKGYDDQGKEFKTSKKIVMKGFDKKKISKFQLEDFYCALEGDLRRLKTTNPEKFATFKTAVKNNKFLMLLQESPREIRSRYDKRRIIKTNGPQIWDTEPLHIRDGEIVNMPDIKTKNHFKAFDQAFNEALARYED